MYGLMLCVVTIPEDITLATGVFPRPLGSRAFRTFPQFDGVASRERLDGHFEPPLNHLVAKSKPMYHGAFSKLMVRLVFRPYTQIRRSICTSEPLRASTRVSSGFTLFRHSSPSFGSQQLCSYSDPSVKPPDRSTVHPRRAPACIHFHCADGLDTQTLA
jgi:hypothetical protein